MKPAKRVRFKFKKPRPELETVCWPMDIDISTEISKQTISWLYTLILTNTNTSVLIEESIYETGKTE